MEIEHEGIEEIFKQNVFTCWVRLVHLVLGSLGSVTKLRWSEAGAIFDLAACNPERIYFSKMLMTMMASHANHITTKENQSRQRLSGGGCFSPLIPCRRGSHETGPP